MRNEREGDQPGAVAVESESGAGEDGFAPRLTEDGIPLCWTRGGLSVTTLAHEFRDPAWAGRGQYRSLLQFIMNWNNWPSEADRAAMLDGSPPEWLTRDEKARIAAVVHCLCDRDGWQVPDWVWEHRARRGGVFLTRNAIGGCRPFWPDGYTRLVKKKTPAAAWWHRVWFAADSLSKT